MVSKTGDGGQKAGSSIYKISPGVSCTAWCLANNAVLHMCKLVREQTLNVLITRNKIITMYGGGLLTRLIVIILQYTRILNHYVILPKPICYLSIIPQLKKNRNKNGSQGTHSI